MVISDKFCGNVLLERIIKDVVYEIFYSSLILHIILSFNNDTRKNIKIFLIQIACCGWNIFLKILLINQSLIRSLHYMIFTIIECHLFGQK